MRVTGILLSLHIVAEMCSLDARYGDGICSMRPFTFYVFSCHIINKIQVLYNCKVIKLAQYVCSSLVTPVPLQQVRPVMQEDKLKDHVPIYTCRMCT